MSRILIRRWLIVLAVLAAIALAIWWANRPKPIAVVLRKSTAARSKSTLANTRAGTVEACLRTRLSTIMGGRIEVLARQGRRPGEEGPVADQAVERRPAGAERAGADAGGDRPASASTEACIAAPPTPNAKPSARRDCAPKASSRARARNWPAPRPKPSAPAATRPRPMSRRPRPASAPPASSRAAPCCTRRSTARSPRSSARSASIRRLRRPAFRRRRPST